MGKPNRVTRLVRIIGILNERRITTDPERCRALHQLLIEASNDLTPNDHKRIHEESLQVFTDAAEMIIRGEFNITHCTMTTLYL